MKLPISISKASSLQKTPKKLFSSQVLCHALGAYNSALQKRIWTFIAWTLPLSMLSKPITKSMCIYVFPLSEYIYSLLERSELWLRLLS